MSDVVAAEGDDLLGSDLHVGLQDDEGLRHFAPVVIWHADDRALHHGRMLGDHLFHLDGGDVLAATGDDVFGAVAQLYVPIGVHDGKVAGVEPAAAEGLGGG